MSLTDCLSLIMASLTVIGTTLVLMFTNANHRSPMANQKLMTLELDIGSVSYRPTCVKRSD